MLLSQQGTNPPAILALADGTVFIGNSIGAAGSTTGEVVFNTAITGYQEILTDPSYCQQIVTLTYPHIGNYGVNEEDVEASKVHAAGLIIRDLPLVASNFRTSQTLSRLPAAREHGRASPTSTPASSRACCAPRARRTAASSALAAGRGSHAGADRQGRRAGRAGAPSMSGLDLAKVVSVDAALRLDRRPSGSWARATASRTTPSTTWSPSTTASRRTSCACWPSAAARSRWCRRRRPRPKCRSSSPTACSCPTAPATRSLATTRSRPRAS